jgi:molybdopterin molybdotransferase
LNELLPVDDALRRILSQIVTLPAEDTPVVQTLGRVLAEDIIARVNVPPFANSSMDGYAVRAGDVKGASRDTPVKLTVVMDIRAGLMPDHVVGPNQAARIMTGAPLPEGADAVIPVEQTDDRWASDGHAPLPDSVAVFRSLQPGDYVRPVGENIQAGQSVLRAGAVLRPQDIGVLVSVGLGRIPVVRQPRVAILSSGDELVDIDEEPAPGQIRNSNGYMLAGLVTVNGGIPIRLPVARDTLEDVRRCFHDALAQKPDLILSSAGVSVGTHDVVRTVVDELGRVELWRVNLRPGKPLAFGQVQGVPFFGLPGNPVSTMVTFELFVRPALLVQSGRRYDEVPMVDAVVGEAIDSDGRRSYLRVTLSREADRLVARSTGTQSSGALLSMVLADGLLVIPEGVTHVAAGDILPVRLLRDIGSGL